MQSWLELPAKVRWKLFRQFQPLDQLESAAFLKNWNPVQFSGNEYAEKMLLRRASELGSTGSQCEAVTLMPPRRRGAVRTPRATACISTQPGCGVGCPFCATGFLGYRGNLSGSEIAEQVYWVGRQAAKHGRQLRNVVYMGMGEPLHNASNVVESLELLTDPKLFGLPQRRITVSTTGVPRAMLQLAHRFPRVKIALSLHAAVPDLRRQLVPKALADLELLRDTIRRLNEIQREGVWLEVVMLGGVNDSSACAEQLIRFCDGLRVEVNLIPYNPTYSLEPHQTASLQNGPVFIGSTLTAREAFAQTLRMAGIRTTIRTSFGNEASAACGQLQANRVPLVPPVSFR
jgi:23S rRNA (adenine2503-C2)-methyltransferase